MHETVKAQDYDRYVIALFSSINVREDIFNVISFNFEVKKILRIVTDPMIGAIRFAWWREGIAEAFDLNKTLRNHELLRSIRQLKAKYTIEADDFIRIIEQYESMLDGLRFKTYKEFEQHIAETDVLVSRIMCEICGIEEKSIIKACEKFAFAFGIIDEIRNAMFSFANKRYNLPEDIFAKNQAGFDVYGKPLFPVGARKSVEELIKIAKKELLDGRILIGKLDGKTKMKAACPLLMGKVAEFYIEQIEANEHDVFTKPISNELNPLQIVKLSLANFFGKY